MFKYVYTDSTLRIVLVGHTGAGKSASGNTILADKAFKVECSSNAVTKFGEKKQGKVENKDVLVIDTPGINDTEMTQEKLKSEIGRCIEMCAPGPHALLLVIRFNRFTMEQQAAVKWIQENFGEGALKYTIVLFTGKEELDGKSVEKFISENPCLQKLVKKCGDRYHAFNNNDISSLQVRELFSKIENMMKINHADCYTKEMYKSTHDLIARREKERKEKKNKRDRETEKEKEKAVLWKGVGAVAGALAGTATGAVIGSVAGPYFGGATVVVQVGAKAMTAATAATAGSATLGAGAGGLAGYGRGPKIRQLYNGLHNGVLNLVNDNSAEKEKTDYEM
ncbi:GTPase IMAP family member 7-like [Clupea harengus]|uniref:GTPase IMAP family member 7-like n=1 Tax=Clupea harengus TaxID=7950 RepID=A0A6P8F1H1_CLUHA|nr:GTPase IMAP family member 7-like [Clupea harengus]